VSDRSADFGLDDDLVEPALAVAFAPKAPVAVGESVLESLGRSSGALEGLFEPLPPAEAGRYRVDAEIGRGGTGVVYQGRDRDLDRDVALKLLRPDRIGAPEIQRRFLEEARIESRLEHPGIAPVFDVGFVRESLPYIAMALVRGRPLSSLLAARSSPAEDQRRFLDVFEQICHVVAHAHTRGVIHRDLKPANVMVGAYGEVYVLDWGLAKTRAAREELRPEGGILPTHDAGLTREGAVFGTPAYLPPEQARGDLDAVTARSDVFALGGILLEILTGKPPHLGTTTDVVLRAARGDLAAALARLDSIGAPPALDALARACLAPRPEDRPADAAAVARSMGEHLAADEERSWRATMEAAHDRLRREAEEDRERLETRRAAWERQAHLRTRWIAAALLLALLVGGGFVLYRQSADAERARAAVARVDDALREAARAEGAGDAMAAEAWALRAVDHARLGSVTADVAGRAEAALARARGSLEDARARARDETLLAALDEADDRLRAGHGIRAAEAAYAAAFAERGVGARETSPDRIAEAFRGTTAAADVAAALESWARLRLRLPGAVASDARPLREAARLLAPDPVRERLIDAALASDVTAFREAAGGAQDRALPRRTLHLVSELLSLREQQDLARPILLAAWARHPQDASLNELIAVAMGGLLAPALRGSARPANAAEAVDHAMAHVAVRPGDPHAWLLLARALDAARELPRAEEACRRALAIDAPDPPKDHRAVLADILAHQGKLEAARTEFLAALEAEPSDTYLWNRLATCCAKLKRLDEALAAVDQGLRHDSTSAALLAVRGDVLMVMGQRSEAERAYRAAAERDPGMGLVWLNLGGILRDDGRLDEAVAAYRDGLAHVPDQPRLLHNLGLALNRVGRPQEALPYLQRCLEVGAVDPPETRMGIAGAYDLMGRTADVERELRALLAETPRHAGARTNLAWILYDRKDFDGALAELAVAVRDEPTLLEAWYYQGLVLKDAGRPREAVESLVRAVELAPEDHQVHFLLGVTYEDGLQEHAKAAEHFRRALAIRPNHLNAYISLALSQRRMRDYAGALESLRLARLVDPKDVRAWTDFAYVLYLRGDWDRAAAECRAVVAAVPGESTASVCLAVILAVTPDPSGRGPAEALALVGATSPSPEQAPALRGARGIALAALGRWEEAVPFLEADAGTEPSAMLALAEVRARQGRPKEARDLVARAEAAFAALPVDPAREYDLLRARAERALAEEAAR
jgi:tetratricopeptide (TPR) repeat protein/predicted Ser/Thr protein kinase